MAVEESGKEKGGEESQSAVRKLVTQGKAFERVKINLEFIIGCHHLILFIIA